MFNIIKYIKKKIRNFKYGDPTSSFKIEDNGLKSIDLSKIIDKNLNNVAAMASPMAIKSDDNGIPNKWILKHKTNRSTIIACGTFESITKQYGSNYKIMESTIK